MTLIKENDLKNLITDIQKYVVMQLDKGKNSYADLANLAECYLSFEELLNCHLLVSYEQVILQRSCRKILNSVWFGSNIFYYSSFYYAYSKVKSENEPEIQQHFHKMNLDIMSMFLNIKAAIKRKGDLGSSEDDCFFQRIERCNWAFTYILQNKKETLYTPALYCLCNLIQTLFMYHLNIKGKFHDEADKEIKRLYQTIISYIEIDEIRERVEINPQLAYFLIDQLNHYGSIFGGEINIDFHVDSLENKKPRTVLRALTNLSSINQNDFISIFESTYEEYSNDIGDWFILDKILLLRNIAKYLKFYPQFEGEITIGIFEQMEDINIDNLLQQVFSLGEIDLVGTTETHIQQLHSMKDDELRQRVSKTIQGVNPIVLEREAKKPHGSFEISDMEVQVTYNGKKLFLCMPFKSGMEIHGDTVPVNITYQIVRPFTEFENCAVVFITAKKCSENLMNQIKKLKDKMHWPIAVIEERALAGLLILHNQFPESA